MNQRTQTQRKRHSCRGGALGRGFTLVEMLVVIAIISILLTAGGPVFDSLANSRSPSAAAAVVSGQLERARSHAIAKNTYVWVRLGRAAEEPNDFFIGVYESLDGTPGITNVKGIWSAPRLPNFSLSDSLGPSLIRPGDASIARVNVAIWVRFGPSGEARIIPAVATASRIKLKPPADDPAEMTRWTEFGLQATRPGTAQVPIEKEIAAVHLNALTGQTLEFSR